ncbi:MAG: glycine dehydrogenase (aminomethyl-transferring), partial [Actinomycetales bacterium]|nr:glycine dehydrogenase (aminomethyl-transferring) [Actinomycetales bacterium]
MKREFVDRHIGPTSDQVATMLHELGYATLDDFIAAVLPESITLKEKFGSALPRQVSETEVIDLLREIASSNNPKRSLIGMGYYGTITPPVVLRNVLENPSWYTAYTPYQPEISQGRLEALFLFQTMVSDLTGLPICNASMLDEATAAAEAMTLARRSSNASDDAIFCVDSHAHPQTIAVIETRAKPLGIKVERVDLVAGLPEKEIFGLLLQYPDTYGVLRDHQELIKEAKSRGALVVMAT